MRTVPVALDLTATRAMRPVVVRDAEGDEGVMLGAVPGPGGAVYAVVAYGRRLQAMLLDELTIAYVHSDWPIDYIPKDEPV